MRVDLHLHTTASDGSWTPEQVVANACEAGIGLLAVTDHDTTANVEQTTELARNAGLHVVPGVEICSTLAGQSFHILGYGIDIRNSTLQKLLRHNTQLMEQTDHDSISKLIAGGLAIDLEEYLAYQHNASRGGWKSLNFLIDKGFCRDANDYFANLFTTGRGISFPEFPLPRQAIEAIRQAGGVPILAHPGSSFHGSELNETLNCFGKEDIAGIECYHSSHKPETIRDALAWCRQHDKLVTGGSDCHGDFMPSRKIGFPEVTIDQLQLGAINPLPE